MRVCLTTSVNYGDVLYYTLPRMLVNFDQVLVVTSPKDEETQEIAREAGSNLLITDAFYRDDAPFNKAQATKQGIQHCKLNTSDHLALVDADIYLPMYAWRHMRGLPRGTIFGCHRRMCKTPAKWQKFLRDQKLGIFPLQRGPRLGKVIGYFQYFSMRGFQHYFPDGYPTPDECKTAERIDIEFTKKWKNHGWLDFQAVHLGPEAKNWAGRVSERFR